MKLILERPIVFFDLETTGVDRDNDRIVEIAVCKVDPSWQINTICKRVNPTIPIPRAASEVHGITDEMVKDEPKFNQIAKAVMATFEGCDVAGFNSNSFDVPVLFNEFARAGLYWDYSKFKMLDAGNLFKIEEPRTLTAAVKFYLGKELEGAHNAKNDIEATVEVFIAQLTKYEQRDNFPKNVSDLALYTNYGNKIADLSGKFVFNDKGDLLLNFGKHKGEKAIDQIGFIDWMINKASFPPDTVAMAEAIYTQFYSKQKPYWEQ